MERTHYIPIRSVLFSVGITYLLITQLKNEENIEARERKNIRAASSSRERESV